jgi:serine/threonine protein kinase
MDLTDFEEVKKLGTGGYGVVRLVENRQTGDQWAVKYVGRDGDEFDSSKLMREVSILFSLRHPCIIKTIGWSPATELTGMRIVTEYASQGSLEDALVRWRKGEPPSFWTHTNVSIMIAGLVLGMKYVHARNVKHRDLKPGNLLLNEQYRILICDFGNSKLEECGTTTTTRKAYTPLYSAPETVLDDQTTRESDVFSFGLIFYEMIVGQTVFPKDTTTRNIVGLHVKQYRPEIPDDVRPPIAELIKECWAMQPSDRPSFDDVYRRLKSIGFAVWEDVDSAAIDAFIGEVESQEEIPVPIHDNS